MAVYYRTNLTMRQLAPLFGVSPPTVCRVVQRLGPPADVETRLVVTAARPVPGTTHRGRERLAEHHPGTTVPGDGAHIDTGLIVPRRRRPGRPLIEGEKKTVPSVARCAPASSTSSPA